MGRFPGGALTLHRMSVRITYFVHGTTTDNEKEVSSGWHDVELSDLGVLRAHELRRLTEDKHFDAVFCSDLKRAVHSAEIAFGGRAPITHDARLRECNYGDFNGKASSIVEPMQEHMITERFPGGESCEDVQVRIAAFLTMLEDEYGGTSIAIVAHKAPQLALDVLLKGKSWQQAFAEDWRKTKAWKPGWEYEIKNRPS